MRQWIKNPLAILAEGAGGGVVVEDGKIAALVASGKTPEGRIDETFDASRHVVIPRPHQYAPPLLFQTLTRANPASINRSSFPG